MAMHKTFQIEVNSMQRLWPFEVVQEIQNVMEEGEACHPHDSWKEVDAVTHVQHAKEHLRQYFSRKQDGEDHLAHAFTRLMMAAALDKGYVKGED